MEIQLIGVPSHAGALYSGTEQTPAALRGAGLHGTLTAKGIMVRDLGDLVLPEDLPRHNHPPVRNWPAPRMVWEAVRDAAVNWFAPETFTLVLGGDCSLVVGTVDSLCQQYGDKVYLLVVDAHVDILQPQPNLCMGTAGMGLWFLTRENPFWAKNQSFEGSHISVLACQTEPEQAQDFSLVPLAHVQSNGAAASAAQVLGKLPPDAVVLVHFDVDAIIQDDMPAAYAPSSEGLSLTECRDLLSTLLADPRVIGLEVTEFSAINDPDGIHAERLVHLLADVLASKTAVHL